MNKILRLSLISLSSFALVGCGPTATESSTPEGGVVAPTLTNSFLSSAHLSYSNMRPTYNYYLTTFAFENLETYSDNTYCLTLSSSTFSAVILPDEGNDATGNERENSLVKYYGTYSQKVDDLDEDTVYYQLSEPNRIVGSDDTRFFYDTENWTADMKKNTADVTYEYNTETGARTETGKKEYETGAQFLAAKKFASLRVTSAQKTHSIQFANLNFAK